MIIAYWETQTLKQCTMLFGSKKTLQHDRLLVCDERINCESPWWVTVLTGSADKRRAKESKKDWTQTQMSATTQCVLSKCANHGPKHSSSLNEHMPQNWKFANENNLFYLYLPQRLSCQAFSFYWISIYLIIVKFIFFILFYLFYWLCDAAVSWKSFDNTNVHHFPCHFSKLCWNWERERTNLQMWTKNETNNKWSVKWGVKQLC